MRANFAEGEHEKGLLTFEDDANDENTRTD